LSRYMLMQNFIELSPAVYELSCAPGRKTQTKTIQSVANARTVGANKVIIIAYLRPDHAEADDDNGA